MVDRNYLKKIVLVHEYQCNKNLYTMNILWFSIEDLSADLSVDSVKIIILHHIKMNTLITVKYASVLETVQCLIQMLNHIIIIII